MLRRPDGSSIPLKVRSIVGLMPLVAATVISGAVRADFPQLMESAVEFMAQHPALVAALPEQGRQARETSGPVLLAMFNEERLRRILAKMLDEGEFLGPHGIRAISRYHAEHPYILDLDGQEYSVNYLPAESDTGMFGGNSNWRGPVWMPINVMLIRGLLNLYEYYGDSFTVECPTGSGQQKSLYQVAEEISERLIGTFRKDADGHRPVHGGEQMLQTDPNWRDLVLFYEYYHGDNGAGIGASHQTGWSGMVGVLPLLFRGGSGLQARGWIPAPRAGETAPAQATVTRMTGWPDIPVIYEVNTAVWLAELTRAAGEPVTLGSVHRLRLGRGHPRRRRRGLADGRLGAQPGRPPARAGQRRAAAVVPRGAARRAAAGHHRVPVLRPPLHGRRAVRRPGRAGGGARGAGRPRGAADPGLRAQPRRARPPLGHRAPGVLHPGRRRRPHVGSGRLAVGRRARARARP